MSPPYPEIHGTILTHRSHWRGLCATLYNNNSANSKIETIKPKTHIVKTQRDLNTCAINHKNKKVSSYFFYHNIFHFFKQCSCNNSAIHKQDVKRMHSRDRLQYVQTDTFRVGTRESFFCVRIESAIRFDFESNFRIESAVYTTQAVTLSNELQGAPCRRTV